MSQELQIVALAGQGASVDEIASELELEPTAVKFVLDRHGMSKEDEISDDDFDEIRRGLVDLAKYSQNEFVKAKVGIFLYERKKGPTNSMKGAPAVNIGNLNLLIAASHERIAKALSNSRIAGGAEGNVGTADTAVKIDDKANITEDSTKPG